MNTRRFTRPFLVLALAGPLALGASSAFALSSPVQTAIDQLKGSTHVYVDSSAEGASLVDVSTVNGAIDGTPIEVAVLPASASSGDTKTDATDISEGIGNTKAFTITLIGKKLDAIAGSATGAPSGAAESMARSAQADHSSSFDKANVTGAIVELVQDIRQKEAGTGSTSNGAVATTTKKSSTGASVFGVIVLVLLVIVGFFALRSYRRKKQRQQDEFASAKAEVDGLYSRLANDVATLDMGENAVAQQAMADASERYNTAGTGLTLATSVGQLAAVRRTVIEGVEASRTARRALGLDPGADPAPAPTSGQSVTDGQFVNVGGQQYQGYGSYQPGNGYYFGGGNYNGGYVPGGWYATPFWEQLLITEAVFGGFGGWGFGGGGYGYGYGGGFGGGYDQGYAQGYDQGIDQNAGGGNWGGGGGDWGSSGGGDWGGGGGGGDWGGGGGGGDWGGGGGGSDGGAGW